MSTPVVAIAFACAGAAIAALVTIALTRARSKRTAHAGPGAEAMAPARPGLSGDGAGAGNGAGKEEASSGAAKDGAAPDARSQALERGDRLRSQLTVRMSHDLRTPLNSVITLSQLLGEGTAGPLGFEQKKFVEIIHRSGQALLTLINEILDLSAIESGRLELELGPVDLRALIEDVAKSSADLARRKGLPLHATPPRRATLARADEDRLRQALGALVAYAIDETANGYVELSVDGDGRRALIRVTDTGRGLPTSMRGASLDDLLAGSRETAAGLGLMLTGKLIALMHGEITVDSVDGEGTTFQIALPAAAEDARARPRPSPDLAEPTSSEPATGHVLLIEDDELERRRVAGQLEAAGLGVTRASSGEEGLNLLRDGRFDAVILDLVMPGMSGLDVLRAARTDERLAVTPFIVLSALYMTKSERDVLGPSVAAVVRKGDGNSGELVTQLRRALAASGAARAPRFVAHLPVERRSLVLIVEDNDDNLFTIKQVLAPLPVAIETAGTGQQAIDICHRHRPDLILMDVELPGISGLDASRRIRDLPSCHDVPIIALTADAMNGDRERVLAARCSEYLSKPLHPQDVVDAVTRALQLDVH